MPNFCNNKECEDRLSYLPTTDGKFRRYEQLGLRVRSFVRLNIHEKLEPFKLAEVIGLKVLTPEMIDGLSDQAKRILSDPSLFWSGGATPELSDGTRVVVLNSLQSPGRQAATLMEEICHVLLGHQHSRIAEQADAGNRDFHDQIEEEAYSVGAAALVPYRSLFCDLSRGRSIRDIARHFGVTTSLVKYRIRVLHLMSLAVGT